MWASRFRNATRPFPHLDPPGEKHVSRRIVDLMREVKRQRDNNRNSPAIGGIQFGDRLNDMFGLVYDLADILNKQEARIVTLEAASAESSSAVEVNGPERRPV